MTISFLLRWFLLWLGLGASMRVAFLFLYPEHAVPPSAISFVVGALNDAVAFVIASAIFTLFGLLHKKLVRPGLFFVNAVVLIVFIAEIFFWIEFESRLDRLVFHYLAYPKEVLVFLEEQFYLSIFFIPFAFLVWLLCLLIGRPDQRSSRNFDGTINNLGKAIILFAGCATIWLGQAP